MALKEILVHVDSSPRSSARLDLAFDLAGRHSAHVTALYVIDLPPVPLVYGNPAGLVDVAGIQEMSARMLEAARQEAELMQQRFSERLARHDLRGEWRQVEGPTAERAAADARYADLVILGQRSPGEFVPSGGDIVPEVIMSSGRPALLVPYAGDFATVGRNVLVGWKPSREAARAVHDAIPLMKTAQAVKILSVNPVEESTGGDLAPADVALYLARHGIKAEATYTIVEGIGEGNVLLNAAADMGADLIVIGGYGHSRTREFVFGGVTRTLLSSMTVPVLFSH